MKYVYANNAATMHMKPETIKAISDYMNDTDGNPSSLDAYGKKARNTVEKCREKIARACGCATDEMFFTSGGSESNNLAIRGALFKKQNMRFPNIVTVPTEHESVLRTARNVIYYPFYGEVKYAPVDAFGLVKTRDVIELIDERTACVSVSVCNNELGVIQDIGAIYDQILSIGENRPLFHVDAVQGMAHLPYDSFTGKCDMFSYSGHKIGAPKGIGGIYVSRYAQDRVAPQITGGNQELGMRAGTENTMGIVGLAAALEHHTQEDNEHVSYLTNMLYEKLIDIDNSQINTFYKDLSVPGIINISFKGIEAEALLIALEQNGILVSAGSACAAATHDPSHVLEAIGLSDEFKYGTIRISLGDSNTEEEVEYIAETLPKVVHTLRFIGAGVREI